MSLKKCMSKDIGKRQNNTSGSFDPDVLFCRKMKKNKRNTR